MHLPPISLAGFLEAQSFITRFSTELFEEAGRIARRHGAEEASPIHVRAAAEHLYRGAAGRRDQALASVGGTLAGIGGSAVVGFLTAARPQVLGAMLGVGVMIAGVIAVTLGLAQR